MADWTTVFQSAVGPIVGSAITLFATRSADREQLSAALIWIDHFDEEHGHSSCPLLHIHNRSSQAIMIASAATRTGNFFKKINRDFYPLDYEDPFDLDFPYRVEAGEVWRKSIDPLVMLNVAESAKWYNKGLEFIGFPFVRIGIRTMTGSSCFTNAALAIPWNKRPWWVKGD